MNQEEPAADELLAQPDRPKRRVLEQLRLERLRSRRWVPHTLRARLVTGVVALVVVIVAAVGSTTFFSLRSFLYQRLDQQVTTGMAQDPDSLVRTSSTGAAFHLTEDIWFVFLDQSGAPYVTANPNASTLGIHQLNLSASQRAWFVANVGDPITIRMSDGTRLRLDSRVSRDPLNPASQTAYLYVFGLSTQDVARTMHRLVLLETLVGGGAVLIALLLTSFGVRLSLRPLNRVTSTARTVTEELSPDGAGLDRRVDVTDPDSEVGELAVSMNTLLEAVETQFAARLESELRMRQFLADASHELRTPLTSIRGYAELDRMKREYAAPTDNGTANGHANGADGRDETLARIEAEGTRMSRLVDDLLTLARGDHQTGLETVEVDVADVLATAVEGVRAAYPDRPIEIVAPTGLMVEGDYDKLLRIVRNLVTNACVHTAAGGPIRVSATEERPWIVVQVADSGPGLPPDQAARVFERFWRADSSRTRRTGGTGLGLPIVQALVEAHGGAIRFDSAVASGSTVTVHLPEAGYSTVAPGLGVLEG